MTDKTTAPEAKAEKNAEPETVRVQGPIPKTDFDVTFDGEAWDLRLTKTQYLAFIVGERAKTLRENSRSGGAN